MLSPTLAAIGLGSAELLLIGFIALLVILPFALIPAILSYILLNRIPAGHRRQEPGLAFLLLIPLFSMIWAFFVYPRIADSLASFFGSRGIDRGDCGRRLATATCICTVCSIIPVFGALCGLAALVLLIIFFAKAFDLTGEVQRQLAVPAPAQPIAPPAV